MMRGSRQDARGRRHTRVRKHINGTGERPRLAVFRSNKYIYAQVIDDVERRTLAAASSQEADLRSDNLNLAAAAKVGETVAAAKDGTSPEFLIQRREADAANDPMAHAIFHVSDLAATLAAAKAAGATTEGDVVTVPIGGMPVKIATVVDPDGNVLELMELPNGADHLPHP